MTTRCTIIITSRATGFAVWISIPSQSPNQDADITLVDHHIKDRKVAQQVAHDLAIQLGAEAGLSNILES